MIGLQPSAFVRSGLDHHGHAAWRLPSRYRDLLKQYDKARRQRWSSDPIIVQNAPGATTATAATFTRSRVETRSAPVTDVEPSRRQITLLVAPAEVPSLVTERHRTFWETFSHGCFRGAEADPAKIRLNRDHANERVIGAATTIDPWSELGCVGVFRVSRTPLGDETLALAEDGVLSASAAFKVAAGGDEWPDQSHRRIKRGALIHTALTPEPAHEGAVVLDVRGLELAGAR
jgi:phage head maturation protease